MENNWTRCYSRKIIRCNYLSALKILGAFFIGCTWGRLTKPERSEVAHKVDSGLSPTGHQPQCQEVSSGQHRPGWALPTQGRPEGRRAPVPSIVELNVWAGVTWITGTFSRGGLQSGVERGRTPWGLWEGRGRAQRSHSEQTVDQEEAKVELDLVFRGAGLHGEVAVGRHGDKVVLLGFLVWVHDHAVPADCLAAEVHHVHLGGKDQWDRINHSHRRCMNKCVWVYVWLF